MIPYGRQSIEQDDIDEVVKVLQSDYLTQGPQVPLFEQALCQYTGAQHAIAVNSATSALHLACLALGLEPGDWFWTTPISFVASANCGLYCGASIDFVDIDPKTFNLCPKALKKKLEQAQQENKIPKIIITVHMAGQSCNMEEIAKLAKQYNIKIIEDASHGIGGAYQGKKLGSCFFSDITVFSFHPVKIITTAEGGVALTNQEALAEKLSLLRCHGITRDTEKFIDHNHGAWYYEQQLLGYNYRMTDIQAALGISQLKKIDQFISLRKEIASRYQKMLKNLPITVPALQCDTDSSWHLFIIRLQTENINKSQKNIFDDIREKGIGVNLHYIPIYKHPWYKKVGFHDNYCVEAEQYYQSAISLPIYPTLSEDDQQFIIHSLVEAVS